MQESPFRQKIRISNFDILKNRLNSDAVGVRNCIISKLGVNRNFRVRTKNHATDSKIRSPEKSTLEPLGPTGPPRQHWSTLS